MPNPVPVPTEEMLDVADRLLACYDLYANEAAALRIDIAQALAEMKAETDATARREERERCAKVADKRRHSWTDAPGPIGLGRRVGAGQVALNIRSLPTPEQEGR